MHSGLQTVVGSILSRIQTQFVPVRYRYYAEKIASGPTVKKFGYNDKISRSGPLPRLKDADVLPGPVYRPSNAWSREKALKGKNDYIDILGGGKLKPHDVSYEVPFWLRGKKGNEFKLLLVKEAVYRNTLYEVENPSAWFNISRRIKYLYKYLNRKTKTGFTNKQ